MGGRATLAPCPEEPCAPQRLSWASLRVAGTTLPYVPWRTCDATCSVALQKTTTLGRLLLSPHSAPDHSQARTARWSFTGRPSPWTASSRPSAVFWILKFGRQVNWARTLRRYHHMKGSRKKEMSTEEIRAWRETWGAQATRSRTFQGKEKTIREER